MDCVVATTCNICKQKCILVNRFNFSSEDFTGLKESSQCQRIAQDQDSEN